MQVGYWSRLGGARINEITLEREAETLLYRKETIRALKTFWTLYTAIVENSDLIAQEVVHYTSEVSLLLCLAIK